MRPRVPAVDGYPANFPEILHGDRDADEGTEVFARSDHAIDGGGLRTGALSVIVSKCVYLWVHEVDSAQIGIDDGRARELPGSHGVGDFQRGLLNQRRHVVSVLWGCAGQRGPALICS